MYYLIIKIIKMNVISAERLYYFLEEKASSTKKKRKGLKQNHVSNAPFSSNIPRVYGRHHSRWGTSRSRISTHTSSLHLRPCLGLLSPTCKVSGRRAHVWRRLACGRKLSRVNGGRRGAQLCSERGCVCLGDGTNSATLSFRLNAARRSQTRRRSSAHSPLSEPVLSAPKSGCVCDVFRTHHFTTIDVTPTPCSHPVAHRGHGGE